MEAETSEICAGTVAEGTILEEQMKDCDEIEKRIMRPDDRLDPTDEYNIFTKIDHQYGNAKKKTIDILTNRYESLGLNSRLKNVIHGMIEEREFLARLPRKGSPDDDLKTVVHWFKLYSTVVLDEYREIPYEFALTEFKEYRNQLVHPEDGIPKADDTPEPSLLGFLTLSWIAMERILSTWEDILTLEKKDNSKLNNRETALENENPKYGFVHYVGDDHAYVTTYTEGQGGKSTFFDLRSADYFPDEYDIVKLEDKDIGRQDLTARWVKRYDL
jgi:hypothetical protein